MSRVNDLVRANDFFGAVQVLRDELMEAEVRAEQYRRDAQRYQHLRQRMILIEPQVIASREKNTPDVWDLVDQTIDKAIAEESTPF